MSLSALAFLGAFAGLLLLAAVRHPVYGLYAYVLTYFLHPPSRWWAADLPDIRWAYWSAIITLVLTAFHLLFRSSSKHRDWYLQGCILLVVSYMAWMWIQSAWAINSFYHGRALGLFQNYVVVVFLVYVLLDSRQRLKEFLFVITMGGFYLGYVAYTSGGGGRLDGVGGPGINDASSLGMVLAVAVMLGAALFLSQRGYLKWLSAIAMPFLLNGLVMTGSRGAFLAIACGGICLVLNRPLAQTGRIMMYAFLGGLAFLYLANDFFWERMSTITAPVEDTQEADLSTETRIVLLGKQWQMFLDHPLGGGAKTTQFLSPDYLDERYRHETAGRASHNTVMSALVDQGFPGLVLWLAMVAAALRKLARLRGKMRELGDLEGAWLNAGVFGAFVVFLVSAQFAPFLQQEIFIWLLGATWACYSHLYSDEPRMHVQPSASPAVRLPAREVDQRGV